MPTPGPQPQEISTLLYRIADIEQKLKQLQEQLKTYVPVSEHALQLQNIQATVARIERDVIEIKSKQETMEKEARERDDQQREAQSALQIRVLVSIVTGVVVIVGSIITGYITHFFR